MKKTVTEMRILGIVLYCIVLLMSNSSGVTREGRGVLPLTITKNRNGIVIIINLSAGIPT